MTNEAIERGTLQQAYETITIPRIDQLEVMTAVATPWTIADEADIYARQRGLDLIIPEEVAVIGVGGVGYYVAWELAMMGIKTLHLFDNDKLEITNLGRLPFTRADIGKLKTEATKEHILVVRPEADIILHENASALDIKLLGCPVVFDCTDKAKIQMVLYDACKEKGIKYIRIGYDGNHITVTRTPSDWAVDDTDLGDYTTAPSWVVPAILSATLGIISMNFEGYEVSTHIADLHQQIPRSGILEEERREIYREGQDNPNCEDCEERRDCDSCEARNEGYDEGRHEVVQEFREQIRRLEERLVAERETSRALAEQIARLRAEGEARNVG